MKGKLTSLQMTACEGCSSPKKNAQWRVSSWREKSYQVEVNAWEIINGTRHSVTSLINATFVLMLHQKKNWAGDFPRTNSD